MAVLAPPVQMVASGAPPFVHVPSGAPPFVAVAGLAPPIMLVASGAPPITLFNEDGSLWAGGGSAAVGGAALLVGETDGFAADFTHAVNAERVAKKTAGTVVSSGTSFFTSSGTSSKWVYDVTGTLGNIASGTLPIDYDPVTHAALGLLQEPAATNLQVNSQDMSLFTADHVTVTTNNQTAPDGTSTADTVTEDTALTSHSVYASGLVTANIDHTVSVFYKMGTRRYVTVGWSDGTNGAYGVFDLQSGVIGSSAAFGTGTLNNAAMQSVGNGWYRCAVSGRVNATNMYRAFGSATAATITPDGFGRQVFTGTSATRYMWQVQLETGTIATSPIPTAGSTVTRAVDSYNCTAASVGNSATTGSWWAEMYHLAALAGTPRIIGTNGTASPLYYTAATTPGMLDTTGLTQTTTTIVGSTHKVISAYASGDRAFTADGLAAATDAGATSGLLGPTTIFLGSGGSAPMNGYLRKVRYLPRRPTNAEIATMTA